MKRALRRMLRGWHDEFTGQWRRLNTFMRVVVGVVLSMALIWSARHCLLDPLQKHLGAIRTSNADSAIPDGMINAEKDPEILETRLKIENMQSSLEEARARVRALAVPPAVQPPAARGEMLNSLDALISRHGLLAQSRTELIPENPESMAPLTVSRHHYNVTGAFSQIHSFLCALNQFPYLSRFDDFEINLNEGETPASGRGILLKLEFQCALFCYQ